MAVSLAGGEGEGLLFEDVMLALESERAGESGRIVLVVLFGKDGIGQRRILD